MLLDSSLFKTLQTIINLINFLLDKKMRGLNLFPFAGNLENTVCLNPIHTAFERYRPAENQQTLLPAGEPGD